MRATAWKVGGFGFSQVLRFGSNLILARLLVPEDFGLMLLVNVVLHGLEMFSDLGLAPALIQHPRGNEPSYLRTAWTIGLARGVALWLTAALLAWPFAAYYNEPRLIQVLPVAGFALVLDATSSNFVSVLERRLDFGRIVVIDLLSYALSVAFMIAAAQYTNSVWPLVAGGLLNAGVSSMLTHFLPGAIPMRIEVNWDAVRQLTQFGRWLFLSSILTFLASQLDRLMLPKLLTVNDLGVYAIASMIAQVTVTLMHELSRRMLYPIYARMQDVEEAELRRQVRRYRIALLCITVPPLLLLYAVGPELVRLLYDHRYWDAGWMLQVLSVGALVTCVLTPAESVLLARGDSFRHMQLQGIEAITMGICMYVGYRLGGTEGLMVGYALCGLAQYPFLTDFIRRHRVWLPGLDIATVLVIGFLLALINLLREYFQLVSG